MEKQGLNSSTSRYTVGAAAGVAAGAGVSAAGAYAVSKAIGAGGAVLAQAAPRFSRVLATRSGLIATGIGVSLAAVGAVAGARRAIGEGRTAREIVAAAGLGAIGVSDEAATAIINDTVKPSAPGMIMSASPNGEPVVRPRVYDYGPDKAPKKPASKGGKPPPLAPDVRAKDARDNAAGARAKGDEAAAKRWEAVADAYEGKTQNQPAQPQQPKSLLQEVKEFVTAPFQRDPSYAEKERELLDGVKQAKREMADDIAKRPKIGDVQRSRQRYVAETEGGSYEVPKIGPDGKPVRDAKGEQVYDVVKVSVEDSKLGQLRKQEQESNVFRQGFQTFAPIGAALGGLAAGGAVSGADKVAKNSAKAAREVAQIAAQADKLTRRGGVIAGTVAGDRARAIVETGKAAVAGMGKAHWSSYAWPAFNITAGGAELYYGYTHGRDTTIGQTARVAGGFELGLGLGQLKAITAAAGAVQASKKALSQLSAAENRIARETAHGASRVSRAGVGAAVARAKGAEAVTKNVTSARVSRSQMVRDTAKLDATLPARKAGVATADKIRDINVARKAGLRDTIRAQQDVSRARKVPILFSANDPNGPAKSVTTQRKRNYKDTWTDDRGVVYRRRDLSVRKPNGKRSAA